MMMTRGKTTKDEVETAESGNEQTPHSIPEGLPKEMWVQYLIDMQKLQHEKDVKLQIEKLQHDRELEKIKAEKEIELRELEFSERSSSSSLHGNSQEISNMTYGYDIRRVPRLRDDDDIDVYLRAFELLAEGNGWDKSQWEKLLIPSLSGKAREVYANLSVADSQNYDVLKTAILAKYEINAESYRIKFRNTCRKPDETIAEWINDLSYFLDGWIKFSDIRQDSVQAVKELLIVEQAIGKFPDDLAIYIKDKQVKTAKDLAQAADQYVINRGGKKYWKHVGRKVALTW
ncbi:hypothetical protein HOLleu_36732 [Holothuria leucospilota]|uniref:Uncharacterized protein n=1 Tax=Holothuria leucospilota TaxID=206669 RepID=A0A9Q0YPN9_HOLLE|nr:hypothetical protein HOLleu_36732 [Holothuria leucospilota]